MHFLLSFDLPARLDLLLKLRRTIRDALFLGGVVTEDIDELELMIGELATNAACHSQSGLFRVEVHLTGQRVTITVADTGKGFDHHAVASPGTARSDGEGGERIGGWGIPLVELLADEVTFSTTQPHGTTVCAVKSLRRNQRP